MRIVIHIGTEKTATTTLQHTFLNNKQLMGEYGIYYSESMGSGNSRQLVAACMGHAKIDDWIRKHQMSDSNERQRFSDRLQTKFFEEIANVPKDCDTVLVSSEQFHSRLSDASELKILRKFLQGFFEKIDIVVYLRLQSSLLQSKYTTYLRSGGNISFNQFKLECAPDNLYYNYANMLSLWANEFGRENIKVREFDSSKFYNQHICYDFIHVLRPDKGPLPLVLSDVEQNRSITRMGLIVLRILNIFVSAWNKDGKRSETSRWGMLKIVQRYKTDSGSKPRLLSTEEVERINDSFRASNNVVESAHDISLFR
jgi:hypothetical protein